MSKRGLSFWLVLITSLLFLTPKFVQANNLTAPAVIFSEVGWAGSSNSASDEWFELKNISNDTVDLSNWQVEITGGSSPINITLTGEILPNQNLVYSRLSPGHPATSVVTALTQPSAPILSISRALSLPNTNLKMTLSDSLGNLVDVAGDGATVLAGTSSPRASMVRKLPTSDGSLATSWYTANYQAGFVAGATDLGTPGLNNQTLPLNENFACTPTKLILDQVNNITCSGDVLDFNNQVDNLTLNINNVSYPISIINGHWQWQGQIEANQPQILVEINTSNLTGNTQSTFTLSSFSTSNQVVINEIMPNPQTGSEWIELYNDSSTTVNLSGWSLDDLVNAGSKPYYFTDGQVLPPKSYLVLDSTQTNIALNNTGDEVNLFDPLGQVVSKASYGNSVKGSTYARHDTGDFAWDSLISPGSRNSFPAKVIYSDQIKINEFLPNPVGNDTQNEWIELKNNSNQDADLSNWILDDNEVGSKAYVIIPGTIIKAHGYLVLPRTQTKLALNNNSDQVRLFSPDNEMKEHVNYANAKEGLGYAIIEGKWIWTNRPTNNSFNLPSVQVSIKPRNSSSSSSRLKSNSSSVLTSNVIAEPLPNYPDIIYQPVGQVKGASIRRDWPFWLKVASIFAILFFVILLSLNIWLKSKTSKNLEKLLKNTRSP